MYYYYHVSNLREFAEFDYKGLDISQFVAGSQVYNDADNEFAVASTEAFQGEHADVTAISEEDYTAYREEYLPKPVIPVTEDKLKEFQERQDATDMALIALMDAFTIGSLSS